MYSSDLWVRVDATALSTYSDLTVVCGPLETSDSTEVHDRGEKFGHYPRLPSLRHYLLVSQRERRLEVYSRDAAGGWMFTEAAAGDSVDLGALGIQIATDRVYRDPRVSTRLVAGRAGAGAGRGSDRLGSVSR